MLNVHNDSDQSKAIVKFEPDQIKSVVKFDASGPYYWNNLLQDMDDFIIQRGYTGIMEPDTRNNDKYKREIEDFLINRVPKCLRFVGVNHVHNHRPLPTDDIYTQPHVLINSTVVIRKSSDNTEFVKYRKFINDHVHVKIPETYITKYRDPSTKKEYLVQKKSFTPIHGWAADRFELHHTVVYNIPYHEDQEDPVIQEYGVHALNLFKGYQSKYIPDLPISDFDSLGELESIDHPYHDLHVLLKFLYEKCALKDEVKFKRLLTFLIHILKFPTEHLGVILVIIGDAKIHNIFRKFLSLMYGAVAALGTLGTIVNKFDSVVMDCVLVVASTSRGNNDIAKFGTLEDIIMKKYPESLNINQSAIKYGNMVILVNPGHVYSFNNPKRYIRFECRSSTPDEFNTVESSITQQSCNLLYTMLRNFSEEWLMETIYVINKIIPRNIEELVDEICSGVYLVPKEYLDITLYRNKTTVFISENDLLEIYREWAGCEYTKDICASFCKQKDKFTPHRKGYRTVKTKGIIVLPVLWDCIKTTENVYLSTLTD
jgi:hypothetical protein